MYAWVTCRRLLPSNFMLLQGLLPPWWLWLWGCNITVDGSFGEKTLSAVKTVQARAGLVADGVVGAKTRVALMGELNLFAQIKI